jgi:hypothetical protein
MAEVPPSRMAQLHSTCPDFPAAVTNGILVTRVTPGSPAAVAGLAEDDVIVGLGSSSSSSSAGGAVAGKLSGGSIGVLPLEQQQQQQQGLGLSVAGLAEAMKASLGGSLELLVVREVTQHSSSSSSSSSSRPGSSAAGSLGVSSSDTVSSSSSSRYVFVRVVLCPVEAG